MGNNLCCTKFQAQGLIYRRYRGTTFTAFLQTSLKNRPDNSELAKHFHESHNLNNDLKVTILQSNIKAAAAWRYHEGKWICKLKTLAPHGLNTEIGDYAKEMYNFYWFTKELYHKFQYYVHIIMKDMADLGLN